MGKRYGKYKLSKKESAISLADGGEIAGSLNFNAQNGALVKRTIAHTGAGNQLTVAQSGATVTLGGGSACTVILPAVADSAGVHFTIVAASAQAHIISSSEATSAGKIQGTIMDGANTANNAAGAGSQLLANEQKLVLANPAIGDTLDCFSDGTNWYFKGAVNDTVTSAA